jgi:hypothetical protein
MEKVYVVMYRITTRFESMSAHTGEWKIYGTAYKLREIALERALALKDEKTEYNQIVETKITMLMIR